jgi:predicted O-methyltransferase YrrM
MKSLVFGAYASLAVGISLYLIGILTSPSLDAKDIAPFMVLTVVFVSLLHRWKTAQMNSISEHFHTQNNRLDNLARELAEVHGLSQLTRFNNPFPLPFGGGWALTADTASIVAREIILARPDLVLELGSVVSTILTATLLKEQGSGKILSLDHDPKWANKTRQLLKAAGLDDVATVYDAPLTEYNLDGRSYNWYQLPDVLSNFDKFDILTVDGPPMKSNPDGMARYPAIPILFDHLSDRVTIFVDDAKRDDEQTMVKAWLNSHHDLEREFYNTADGLVILRREDFRSSPG